MNHPSEGEMMPKRFNAGLVVVAAIFVGVLFLFLTTKPQEPLSAVKVGETAGRVSRDFGSGFLKGFFRSKKAANKL